MYRRPCTVLQPILHRPLHDRGHAFPVQPVLACRALPTQLPRQHGHSIGQRRGHSRPWLRPRKVLHPHPASWAFHPARTVAQFQGQLPHGQIAPLPLCSNIVDLQASLAANPAAQESLSKPVDAHHHTLFGLFHLGHGMSFKRNCFLINVSTSTSVRVLSYSLVGNTKLTRYRGALQIPPDRNSKRSKRFTFHYTFRRGTRYRRPA